MSAQIIYLSMRNGSSLNAINYLMRAKNINVNLYLISYISFRSSNTQFYES